MDLSCGNFTIPLVYIQSMAWGKRARTVQHTGGYVTARGFEAAEISVKIHVDFATCAAFGHDAGDIFSRLETLITDRVSQPGIFYMGKKSIYPTLEFALTNINKTFAPEKGVIEADCVWSGVRPAKNVARESALEVEAAPGVPKITLSVSGKQLVLQDFCAISTLTTTPDSLTMTANIGSDLDLVSRDGFLTALLDGGEVTAELPQGAVKFYVIEADLTEEALSITATKYPPKSAKFWAKTYIDADLSEILADLADAAGIECEILVGGKIDYYRAFGRPLDCIRELQDGAGFLISWRGSVMILVDVPGALDASTTLDYIDMTADEDTEPIRGCYWWDGVHADDAGVVDATALQVRAAFSSGEKLAARCLALAMYRKNAITIRAEILQTLDTHSLVSVQSNDQYVSCLVEWYEMDWIGGMMTVELHHVEGE